MKELCRECGHKLDTASGHIHTLSGDTYYVVYLTYCENCKHLERIDGKL